MVSDKRDYTFARRKKIVDSQDFKRVMRSGGKISSRNLSLFIKENEKGFHRLGTVVPKAVGKAVYRNQLKRFCRECFRLHQHEKPGSFDLVVMVRKGCSISDYKEAEGELMKLLGSSSKNR